MSRYDEIKTAADLVAEVQLHGLSMAQEDICRAQDIFGHTAIEELDRLANDIGRNNENGEPDPKGTWSSGRKGTQSTFYMIVSNIWNWEEVTRFWNQHTNPDYMTMRAVSEENAILRKKKEELESLRDSLLHEQDVAIAENRDLRDQARNLAADLKKAEEDVVRLKARLYDLLVEGKEVS